MKELTQELLKELLHYNPETGVFTWKARAEKHFKTYKSFKVWNARFPAKKAGYYEVKGDYKRELVSILGKRIKSHRLAWLYVYGAYPENQIDHINGIPTDNRIVNLRDVTNQENCKNVGISKNNTSGGIGISWHKASKKWSAYIKHNYKKIHLGLFLEFDDAVKARKEAENEYGFHENHGRDKS